MSGQTKGGIEAQRGFIFQSYALLLHLLIRRIELQTLDITDLSVIVEPEGENDALFLSCRLASGTPTAVTELVECKKIESRKSRDVHAGLTPDDDWRRSEIDYSLFKQWLQKSNGNRTLLEALSEAGSAFLTLIVFGEPKKKIGKYVPAGVDVGNLRWYSPTGSRAFPADYRHPNDPAAGQLAQKTFGTPDIRRRIRILVVDSPAELQAQCELLVRHAFHVTEGKAPETIRRLRSDIAQRALLADPSARLLSSAEIDAHLAAGRADRGSWQMARHALSWDQPSPPQLPIERPRTWIDFQNGTYAHREQFTDAWRMLEEHGTVVVSGPFGSGRTTLTRYAAYRFLTERPHANAYFLAPAQSWSLDVELEFARSRLTDEALFIIDDEHLATERQTETLQALAEAFLDFQREQKCEARLLVTSTRRYSTRQVMVRSPKRSAFNEFAIVHLQALSIEACASLLSSSNGGAAIDTPLSTRQLAILSGGNLSLAALIARSARDVSGSAPEYRFGASALPRAVSAWVLEQIGRPQDAALMKASVAPLFILAAYQIAIPEGLSPTVTLLVNAGLLETTDTEQPVRYHACSSQLASLVRTAYQELETPVIKGFVLGDPKRIPAVCSQLSRPDGRPVLRRLLQDPAIFQGLLKAIEDGLEPLTLNEVSSILDSVYRCNRERAQALVRGLAEAEGRPNGLFLSNFIRLTRATSAHSLARFFTTLDRIDRWAVRRLPFAAIGIRQRNTILALFDYDFCPLDAVAGCLRALSLCSASFAADLYQVWTNSASFARKVQLTETAPDRLTVWLRVCESLGRIDRNGVDRLLEEHLSAEAISSAVVATKRLDLWPRFLLRFRRLHPRRASALSDRLLRRHADQLEATLRRVEELDVVTNQFYALSRFSRRASIALGRRLLDHLSTLVHQTQEQHRAIGSALDVLQRSLSTAIAASLAGVVDADVMLDSLRAERTVNFVGRTLYNIHCAHPALAADLVGRLDIDEFAPYVSSAWLNQLVYLIRGFVAAADPAQRAALLDKIADDPHWTHQCRRAWNEAGLLSDLAFFLLTMLDLALPRDTILAMLQIPNLESLQADLQRRIDKEPDPLELAHGFGAMARLDLPAAVAMLRRHADTLLPRLPHLYSRNLSHMADLLHVAASLDAAVALQMAERLDLGTFARYAIDEPNLGRTTIFLSGLSRASRQMAREFVDRTISPEIWARQWEQNEDFDNVTHYAHALTRIGLSTGSGYVNFLLANVADEIQGILDVEADLARISNWARLLGVGHRVLDADIRQSLSRTVVDTLAFDSRLFQLLDTAQALIQCGELETASHVASIALQNAHALQSIGTLENWITIFHRAISIGRALDWSRYAPDLLSSLSTARFAHLLTGSGTLLAAHASHLVLNSMLIGFERFAEIAVETLPSIRVRALRETSTAIRVLTLILTTAPVKQIEAEASTGPWDRPSLAGLASLLFEMMFPNQPALFRTAPRFCDLAGVRVDANARMVSELTAHTENVAFALTLRLTRQAVTPLEGMERRLSQARERLEDESSGAIRWLLNPAHNPKALLELGHYQSVFLNEAVLRGGHTVSTRNVEEAVVEMIREKR